MATRLGKYTILLSSKPSVKGYASVVGKAEGEGPLAKEFDKVYDDDTIDGCPTWEKVKVLCTRRLFQEQSQNQDFHLRKST